MKKETKRYFLVEYYGNNRTIEVETKEEVEKLLHEIKKYNNRKRSKFLFGNVEIKDLNNKYYLESHLYRKYTDRMTISEIDDLTSKFTPSELANEYKDKSLMKDGYLPDINVAYFETKDKDENGFRKYEKGIKYIPVLYKDDLKYLNKDYIYKCLVFHASTHDLDFFRSLAYEFSLSHHVADEVSRLYEVVNYCETHNPDLNNLYYCAKRLYDKYICEYEKDESLSRDENGKYIISNRRLRDFGLFVKNYNIRDSKIRSPYKYNLRLPEPDIIEEENGQLKLVLK